MAGGRGFGRGGGIPLAPAPDRVAERTKVIRRDYPRESRSAPALTSLDPVDALDLARSASFGLVERLYAGVIAHAFFIAENAMKERQVGGRDLPQSQPVGAQNISRHRPYPAGGITGSSTARATEKISGSSHRMSRLPITGPGAYFPGSNTMAWPLMQ